MGDARSRVCGLLVTLLCGCGRIDFDAAADSATDGSGTFCATQPAATFCGDFDSAPDFSDWSGRCDQMAASISLVENGLSPPSMLHVSSDPLPTINDASSACLIRTFDVSATHAIVAFDLRVATLGQAEPVIAVLDLDDGTASHGFEFVYRVPPQLAYLEERRGTTSPMYNSYPVSTSLPAGEWHRITMDVSLGVAATAQLRYDEQVVLDTTLMGTTGGTGHLALGMAFVRGPSSAWELDIDNVVMTLR